MAAYIYIYSGNLLEDRAYDEGDDDLEVSAHFLALHMIYVPHLFKLPVGPITGQVSQLSKRTADDATTIDTIASEYKVNAPVMHKFTRSLQKGQSFHH